MKKRNLALAMVLAMAMTTMGSATVFADDASDDAAGNDYTIAYVPTTMNNPFWTAMLGGIKEEMEAKGMDVDSQLVTVDANSDQATMNNYVNDLIAQEVDAIILAPMDCTAVTEALQACEDAGIPVINVDTAVDACGLMVQEALKAQKLLEAEGISARVIDMHTIKPIDRDIILKAAEETGAIVTAEEHNVIGGLGAAVAEVLVQNKSVPTEFVGVQDTFGHSASPAELLKHYGLTPENIAEKAKKAISRK